MTDIPKVQADEAKPEDGAQFSPSLGGRHFAGWMRIGAFHLWVWLTLGFENDSGEREVLPTLTFDVE